MELILEQSTHTTINWMSAEQLSEILTDFGFASSGDFDDMRDTVRANVMDGTIPEYIIHGF